MKPNSMSVEDELKVLDSKCKWLMVGEWCFLALSGAGAVLSVLTNQVIFAATPLTFSVFLNMLSRSYRDLRVYDQNSQNLIELQLQYASKLQGLRHEFAGIDLESKDGATYGQFEELVGKVRQLESFLEIQGGDYYSQSGSISQEVGILRNHQVEIDKAIEAISAQLNGGVRVDADTHDIVDHLERLSAAVYDLEQKTAALADGNGHPVSVNGMMSSEQNGHHDLTPIQSQMVALEERLNGLATIDPAYDPETLRTDMESLVLPLKQQILNLEAGVLEMKSTRDSEPESSHQMDSLSHNVAELQSKLEHAVGQVAADTSEFQHSLQSMNDQIDQIHTQMHQLQDSRTAHDPEAMQQQIEAMNAPLKEQLNGIQTQLGEINQLRGQLEQVKTLAQQSSDMLNSGSIRHQVSEATGPLLEKIAGVEQRVQSQVDQDLNGQLHQVVEPLRSHVGELEQRINQLAFEGDRTPLLNQISMLQGQLQTVESRLNERPAQPPVDTSAQLHQVTKTIATMQQRLDSFSQTIVEQSPPAIAPVDQNAKKKSDLLAELDAISFDPEAAKKKDESDLDGLLDALNF